MRYMFIFYLFGYTNHIAKCGGMMRNNKVEICGIDTSALATLSEAEKRKLLCQTKNGTTKERASARFVSLSRTLFIITTSASFMRASTSSADVVGCSVQSPSCLIGVRSISFPSVSVSSKTIFIKTSFLFFRDVFVCINYSTKCKLFQYGKILSQDKMQEAASTVIFVVKVYKTQSINLLKRTKIMLWFYVLLN